MASRKQRYEVWTKERVKRVIDMCIRERKKDMIIAKKHGIKLPNDMLAKMISGEIKR